MLMDFDEAFQNKIVARQRGRAIRQFFQEIGIAEAVFFRARRHCRHSGYHYL